MMKCIVLLALAGSAWNANYSFAEVPRYQFAPGQQLNYEQVTQFETPGKVNRHVISLQYTCTSVDKRGSHFVARSAIKEIFNPDDKDLLLDGAIGSEGDDTFCFDLSPQGVPSNLLADGPSFIGEFFPALPASAADFADGWNHDSTPPGFLTSYRIKQPIDGGTLQICGSLSGPVARLTDDTSEPSFVFDLGRGCVVATSVRMREGSKIGRAIGRLSSQGAIPVEQARQMESDWLIYLNCNRQFYAMLDTATQPDIDQRALSAKLQGLMTSAASKIQDHDLSAELNSVVRICDSMVKSRIESSQQIPLGKPAFAFSAMTVEGHHAELAQLRGKVVVLDFWFRHCGACVAAMPAVRELVKHFGDVKFMGMSIDQDPKDAQAFIDAMQPGYETIRDPQIGDEFGVHEFPTFLVIDRNGNLFAAHSGCADAELAALKADIQKAIDQK